MFTQLTDSTKAVVFYGTACALTVSVSMATHHVARGTDLKTVQVTLGHASCRQPRSTSLCRSERRRRHYKSMPRKRNMADCATEDVG